MVAEAATRALLPRIPLLERLSGKYVTDVTVAYAPRYGEQEIPHGSVRRRMAFHRPPSSRAHGARTPQALRLTSDPRCHHLLRAQDMRVPLALAAEGFPTLEDSLGLVQVVAYRWDMGASKR
jgi:hypothetical protein